MDALNPEAADKIWQTPNGGWLKPFKKGQSGNPGGRTAIQAEARRAARDYCIEGIGRLVAIMRQDDDIRAALIATQTILDRGLGKPRDDDTDDKAPSLDLARCPPEALQLIKQALGMIAGAAPKQEVIPPEEPTTS